MAKANRENKIEFLRNMPSAGVTFTQRRYRERVEKLAAEYPDDCIITARNADGSIEAQIPTGWIKINPPRKISPEARAASLERVEHMRAALKAKKGV